MLKNRIITSAWAIPLLGVIIWFGEPYFTIFIAIAGLLAMIEFSRLTNVIKDKPLTVFGVIWTLLFIVIRNPHIESRIQPYISLDLLYPFLFTAGIAVSLMVLLTRKQKQGAFTDWAWIFAGILYVGWLLSYLVALRGLDGGRSWVFLAIFATFGSDSAAYFVGKTIGKNKLAPVVSPNKTWEGSVGGLIGGSNCQFVLSFTYPGAAYRLSQLVAADYCWLMISVFGQLGDLVESLFKRNAGVKDSGNIFPGHGGMLDRMDSIVFAVVVVYYVVILLGIL